mmetsp:Transcript_74049/g.123667  ORF Transcript_74049/g.123667 Transcript_74049/m.123667 type:complete len:237 (+) Transcript_74049:69-779(+)|eukprot:CAMPEP_0119316878 /NCGR_PEP_ID=MMETSP1333-20130426/41229_1 /TAXON_ID=418940 /ORGANISM="Scyphosphaera apsteinii, Strain RCC1455" /LENGTH=236 /DNA_ID=CAMNT_0007322651 /DNA_START=63 /DNA_END=773 /DNA_ORIENTATION=+
MALASMALVLPGTGMDGAQKMVMAAPSLVKMLDDDVLGRISEHVRDGMLCGRWAKKTASAEVCTDGRLQKMIKERVLWLREDGAAQLLMSDSWTTYKGKTKLSGEYGAGGSTKSIQATVEAKNVRKVPVAQPGNGFLIEPASPAGGIWEVNDDGDGSQVLRLTGSGWYSAGAFEDGDILYHGSGEKSSVEFDIGVAELRDQYRFKPVELLRQGGDAPDQTEARNTRKRGESKCVLM